MILNEIKLEQLKARKSRDKLRSDILTYLIGEIERQPSKDFSDVGVTAVVKKVYKNLEKSLEVAYTDKQHTELCIVNEFLPQALSEEELEEQVEIIVSDEEDYNMGSVMKKLKEYSVADGFDYDGKSAAKIVKDTITRLKP